MSEFDLDKPFNLTLHEGDMGGPDLPAGYIEAIRKPESGSDEILFFDGVIEVRRSSNRILVKGLAWPT